MVGQIVSNVEYAGDDTVIQGMIDRQFKIVRRFGMEMNVRKTKVMRILVQPSHIPIMIDQNSRRMWNILGI